MDSERSRSAAVLCRSRWKWDAKRPDGWSRTRIASRERERTRALQDAAARFDVRGARRSKNHSVPWRTLTSFDLVNPCTGILRALLVAAAILIPVFHVRGAEETKPVPPKPGPPRVLLCEPLAVEIGRLGRVGLRGVDLTNATRVEVMLPGGPLAAELGGFESVTLPEGFEASRAGNQRLNVMLAPSLVPADAGPVILLRVTTPLGVGETHRLLHVPRGSLIGEREPNNGFQEAQKLLSGQYVLGTIDSPTDVDVFAVSLAAGEQLVAEVWADRLGSLVDPSLTLHAPSGAILKVQDDGPERSLGRDARLTWTAPKAGRYLLSLSGVTERGGPLHSYVLSVTTTNPAPAAKGSTPAVLPAKVRP